MTLLPPEDIKRLNPSSAPRWDSCQGIASPKVRTELDPVAVRQRKLSPIFPDIASVLARRRRRRETFAARFLLACVPAGILYGVFGHDAFGFIAAGAAFVNFAILCLVSGSRHGAYGSGSNVP